MSNTCDARRLVRSLAGAGVSVSRAGTGWRIMCPRGLSFIHDTPSDFRWMLNKRSELRKLGVTIDRTGHVLSLIKRARQNET